MLDQTGREAPFTHWAPWSFRSATFRRWKGAYIWQSLSEISIRRSIWLVQQGSDNHGGEVDIWGVGLLIKQSCSFAFKLSNELLKLGQWMQDDEPTAQEALAIIMKYQNDFWSAIRVKLNHNFWIGFSAQWTWNPVFNDGESVVQQNDLMNKPIPEFAPPFFDLRWQ